MAPVVAEIAFEQRNTFAIAKLDREENNKIAQRYGIRIQPIYLVFQDGKLVEPHPRLLGKIPKDDFVQKVLNAINIEEN